MYMTHSRQEELVTNAEAFDNIASTEDYFREMRNFPETLKLFRHAVAAAPTNWDEESHGSWPESGATLYAVALPSLNKSTTKK